MYLLLSQKDEILYVQKLYSILSVSKHKNRIWNFFRED